MTIWEFAMYRAIRDWLPAGKLPIAVELAKMADNGDWEARNALRMMAHNAIRDELQRKASKKAKQAAA